MMPGVPVFDPRNVMQYAFPGIKRGHGSRTRGSDPSRCVARGPGQATCSDHLQDRWAAATEWCKDNEVELPRGA